MTDFTAPAGAGAAAGAGPRASFGTRLVASLIDGAIMFAVTGGGGRAGTAIGGIGTLIGLAYYIYFIGSPSGQTVGKRAMKIRVVGADTGESLGYGGAAVRYFSSILSAIPCGLGYFWMLWDDNKQTWHDKLSSSVVVPVDAYPVDKWPG